MLGQIDHKNVHETVYLLIILRHKNSQKRSIYKDYLQNAVDAQSFEMCRLIKLLVLLTISLYVTATEFSWLRSTDYSKEYIQFIKADGVSKYKFAYAEQWCGQVGGQLLQIGSKAEQDHVHGLYTSKKKSWIGLKKLAGLQTYTIWLNGSLVTHTSWYSGQPNCNSTCCGVYLDTDNTWMDASCDNEQEAMYCERTLTFRDGLSQRIYSLERNDLDEKVKHQAFDSRISTCESSTRSMVQKTTSSMTN